MRRLTGVRVGTIATIGMMAAATLVACGSSGGSGNALTLYNGQHEETTDALVAAFTKQTGIKVNVRSGDEDELTAQIEQEGSHSRADVFYTENSAPLTELDEKHLLAPVDPAALADVPTQYNSPAGDWIGVSARVSCLVYNTGKLSPSQLPTSILDLAQPQWAGKIGIAAGETDFQPLVTSVADTYGRPAALAWLQALKKNAGDHVYPDNETLTNDVNEGQVTIGVINHYYWYRLQSEKGASAMHSAIAYFAPQDAGYLVDVSGAGILKTSKHPAEAQELLAFLVSAAGAHVIATGTSFEYPLGSGVSGNPELRPFDQLQPKPFSVAQIGDGSQALSLLQAAQLL